MESLLRSHRLKITPTRLAVLSVLRTVKKPVDVGAIIRYLNLQKIRVDRVTIFRIMKVFTDSGITRKIELHEGKFRYELSSLPHHHHAVCVRCKVIVDVPECNIGIVEEKVAEALSFQIENHNIEFFGRCARCQK